MVSAYSTADFRHPPNLRLQNLGRINIIKGGEPMYFSGVLLVGCRSHNVRTIEMELRRRSCTCAPTAMLLIFINYVSWKKVWRKQKRERNGL